jgi:hypothetical protein
MKKATNFPVDGLLKCSASAAGHHELLCGFLNGSQATIKVRAISLGRLGNVAARDDEAGSRRIFTISFCRLTAVASAPSAQIENPESAIYIFDAPLHNLKFLDPYKSDAVRAGEWPDRTHNSCTDVAALTLPTDAAPEASKQRGYAVQNRER